MSELKTFQDVCGSLKNNEPVVFIAPLTVKGGSDLFCGQSTVHALYIAGQLRFIDDDPYFAGGHRALRANQIRGDQRVVV